MNALPSLPDVKAASSRWFPIDDELLRRIMEALARIDVFDLVGIEVAGEGGSTIARILPGPPVRPWADARFKAWMELN